MPVCNICKGFTFSEGGVCAQCAYNSSQDAFTSAYRAPKVYYPKPLGPKTSINTPMVEKREVGQGGAFDNSSPQIREICEILIDKFDEVEITSVEAGQKKDHIVTHRLNTNRIDRQGPCRDGTHAKYAIQLGSKTFAGIEMEHSRVFSVEFVRNAFRKSLEDGKWYRIYYGVN